jgi:hypothetical protein
MNVFTLSVVVFALGVAAAPAAGQTGAWNIARTPADTPPESRAATIALRADGEDEYFLGIRCEHARTFAFIAWNAPLGRRPEITARVDVGAPEERVWNTSADEHASFYPEHTTDFVQRLANAATLDATTVTASGDTLSATFTLDGIAGALEPVRTLCHW